MQADNLQLFSWKHSNPAVTFLKKEEEKKNQLPLLSISSIPTSSHLGDVSVLFFSHLSLVQEFAAGLLKDEAGVILYIYFLTDHKFH